MGPITGLNYGGAGGRPMSVGVGSIGAGTGGRYGPPPGIHGVGIGGPGMGPVVGMGGTLPRHGHGRRRGEGYGGARGRRF